MIGNRIEIIQALANAPDGKVYELKEHKVKRSLNQNAYYWQLLAQVAAKTYISRNRLHNELLASYGFDQIIDGQLVCTMLPDTDEAEQIAMEASTYHLRQTSKVTTNNNGERCRVWVLMRGSSEYDTAEMSRLVDGLIEEAKQIGIETLTPDELERMRCIEEQRHCK